MHIRLTLHKIETFLITPFFLNQILQAVFVLHGPHTVLVVKPAVQELEAVLVITALISLLRLYPALNRIVKVNI